MMLKKSLSLFLSALFFVPNFGFATEEELTEWQKEQRQKAIIDEAYRNSNPLYRYTRSSDGRNALTDTSTEILRARVLVVDTRDQNRCKEIERQIHNSGVKETSNSEGSLCTASANQSPYNSVTIYEKVDRVQYERELDISKLTSTERNVFTETRNLTIAAAGFAGLLLLMPSSITKWDKSKDSESVFAKYKDNVRNGPVMDKDDWAVNYIGHPISGAAYYQVARNLGMSKMESFGYSVIMSTFFWEYGIEAFAEKPSIQDLFITPILGSLLGEVFYQLEKKIENQGGTVMGSRRLGSFIMVLLNPAGSLSNQINRMMGSKVIKDSRISITTRTKRCDGVSPLEDPRTCNDSGIGIKIEFKF